MGKKPALNMAHFIKFPYTDKILFVQYFSFEQQKKI